MFRFTGKYENEKRKQRIWSGAVITYGTVYRSVVDPKLFFSDPDPIFRRVFDPDPNPTWLAKSFGSSFGSEPKHSLFHNVNDFKWLFIDFKAYFLKKMLD
jgi:hypothetical protein